MLTGRAEEPWERWAAEPELLALLWSSVTCGRATPDAAQPAAGAGSSQQDAGQEAALPGPSLLRVPRCRKGPVPAQLHTVHQK